MTIRNPHNDAMTREQYLGTRVEGGHVTVRPTGSCGNCNGRGWVRR